MAYGPVKKKTYYLRVDIYTQARSEAEALKALRAYLNDDTGLIDDFIEVESGLAIGQEQE